jgi:hypothetical protein
MAVQQRIIGGGLLLAGIAVVLILMFLFTDKGMPWDEAYAKLRNEIYPRYVEAERAAEYDYLKITGIAQEVKDLEGRTPMASVLKEARADAVKGDTTAQGLIRLFDDGAFDKNLQELYALDGGWFDGKTHGVLRLLGRSLEKEAVPALVEARRTARKAQDVLDQLRIGSGLELATPPAATQGMNPLAAADARLLAVLGLQAAEVQKALAAKGDSAKAKSARLVWNQADSAGERTKLAEALERIPALAETINRAAVALGKSEQDVKGLPASGDGAKRAAEFVRAAAAQLATGLDADARQAFEKDATIAMIADALRQDAKLLSGYAPNARGLGQALVRNFAP